MDACRLAAVLVFAGSLLLDVAIERLSPQPPCSNHRRMHTCARAPSCLSFLLQVLSTQLATQLRERLQMMRSFQLGRIALQPGWEEDKVGGQVGEWVGCLPACLPGKRGRPVWEAWVRW